MLTAALRVFTAWRKWWFVLVMFIQDGLVYKANVVIWILTDLVTAVTMPLIWLASYNGRATIQGFTPGAMISYYLAMLVMVGLIESHVMWDMANDVKQGKFNIYLSRPFSFLSYMLAANLGWRLMRTFVGIPLFALVVLAFARFLNPSALHYNLGVGFWLSLVLAHLLSFFTSYALGLLSLWLYEARSVYNFYYLPMMIFSGQIAPLALFPPGLSRIFWCSPFPYTLAFPVQVFLGRTTSADYLHKIGWQVAWIAIFWILSILLWRGGVKRFTAFGI